MSDLPDVEYTPVPGQLDILDAIDAEPTPEPVMTMHGLKCPACRQDWPVEESDHA